jgi:hypothetical protein
MLVAVAAASPSTTSLPLMNIWENIPVSMVMRHRNPATLARIRGDVWAVRVVILFSPNPDKPEKKNL